MKRPDRVVFSFEMRYTSPHDVTRVAGTIVAAREARARAGGLECADAGALAGGVA